MSDVYENDGQDVEDVQWIADAAANCYIAFTANPAILGVAHEIAKVRECGTLVFCIANPQHNRDGRALIFGRHLLRILRRARKPGPCFWRLYPDYKIKYDLP